MRRMSLLPLIPILFLHVCVGEESVGAHAGEKSYTDGVEH